MNISDYILLYEKSKIKYEGIGNRLNNKHQKLDNQVHQEYSSYIFIVRGAYERRIKIEVEGLAPS